MGAGRPVRSHDRAGPGGATPVPSGVIAPVKISTLCILAAAAAAASATAAQAAVVPSVTCVAPQADGSGLTGYFGYSNAGALANLRIGPTNRFSGTQNQGQPTVFPTNAAPVPGFGDDRTYFAAASDFTGTRTWTLDGGSAAATSASPACEFELGGTVVPDRSSARPGQEVSWDVTVQNQGASPLPRAQIQLDPSAGTTLDLPVLPDEILGGEQFVVRARTTVTPDMCFGTVSATVRLGIGPGVVRTAEEDTGDNTLRGDVPVTCTVDLQVTADTNGLSYRPGQTVTHTVTVLNAGEATVPVSAIRVANSRAATLTPVGDVPGDLAPGGRIVYRGTQTVTAQQCGLLPAVSSVAIADPSGRLTDSAPGDDTWTGTVNVDCSPATGTTGTAGTAAGRGPRLLLRVAGPARIADGRRAVYTVRVRNTGRTTARGVALAFALPKGMILAQRLARGEVRTGNVLWRRRAAIAAGRTWTSTVRVRFPVGSTGLRRVLVRADGSNTAAVRLVMSTRVR